MRPWSPSGGRAELTHHAPDDRHESGAKSGGRGHFALAQSCRTALLRKEVGCTVSDPEEIDKEIHALWEALIASEGRLGP